MSQCFPRGDFGSLSFFPCGKLTIRIHIVTFPPCQSFPPWYRFQYMYMHVWKLNRTVLELYLVVYKFVVHSNLHKSVYDFISLSICLSICPQVCLHIHQSVYMFTILSMSPSPTRLHFYWLWNTFQCKKRILFTFISVLCVYCFYVSDYGAPY